MSGEWKRSKARLLRHRQPKGPATDRPSLNHRVTPRLYGLLPVSQAARCRQPDRLQPLPEQEPGQRLGGRELEISPRLFTSMTFLRRHMLLRLGQVSLELVVDIINDRLMQ